MSKKLLRLHTTDFNSIFDCVFNEEIKINPYSEIALHSASFPLANRFINIDASNDQLTFQVQNGAAHTINITHGTYTKFNATRLLEQITNKMNQDLLITTGKEHGTEISANVNNDTRVSFDFGYANQVVISSAANDQNSFYAATPAVTIGTRGNDIKLTGTGDQSVNNDKGYIVGEVPFTRGCGNIIFDLHTYQGAAPGTNAFTMGLIPKSLFDIYKGEFPNTIADPTQVATALWKFGRPFTNQGGGDGLTQGSKISMDLSNGKISFNEYTAGGAVRELFAIDFDYDGLAETDYYPAIILHVEPQYLKIKNLKYTPTPFSLPPTIENTDPLIETSAFGAAPRPSGRVATIYKITFPANSFRDFLGFDTSILNVLENATRDRAGDNAFRAIQHFQSVVSSDNYMIEMLNIKLDSYDSFTINNAGGGRKSILAPIPVSEQVIDNQTGLVQYEPNTYNFISINNEYALNLRNIRMRIIDFQHAPVLNSGFQSVNIIIRDTEETKRAAK
jgi:hypothetical protein